MNEADKAQYQKLAEPKPSFLQVEDARQSLLNYYDVLRQRYGLKARQRRAMVLYWQDVWRMIDWSYANYKMDVVSVHCNYGPQLGPQPAANKL